MNVTVRRDTTEVDIPLLEQGGAPLFVVDFGKPNQTIYDKGGTLDPRVQDNWSGLVNYNIVGRLDSYADAITLADLIKSNVPDEPLELDIPLPEHPDTVTVNPLAGSDNALVLTYEAGYQKHVQVELGLTRVGNVESSVEQTNITPTASGAGPIQVDTGNSVIDITTDVQVQRSVGRPNDVIRKTTSGPDPYCIQKAKYAVDEFAIEFQELSQGANVLRKLTDDVFRQQLGRRGIDLNFNGVFGLGTFNVVPMGSAPFRQVRAAGEKTVIAVPTFDLRVVLV